VTLTIRVSQATLDTLRLLAEEAGEPMTEVLDRVVDAFRRQRFLETLNEDFARLRDDPAAWASDQGERAAWDSSNGDDLEHE
jgi:hypothetical protein